MNPKLSRTVLANGMTGWFLPNPHPSGEVVLCLQVNSGSLVETEEELGFAHFLEHMAFRGSKHFPAGSHSEFYEKAGLVVGRNLNAFTSLEDTAYSMTLDLKTGMLEECLLFLADIGYRLDLTANAIERERSIIIEEMQAYSSPQTRAHERKVALLFGGSRVVKRNPLGLRQIIETVGRKQLEGFYRQWYRPDRAVLMVVGDMDPAKLEGLLGEHFSPWKKLENIPSPKSAGIRPYTKPSAELVRNSETQGVEISLNFLPRHRKLHHYGDYLHMVQIEIGRRVLNRRLDRLIKTGSLLCSSASMGVVPLFGTYAQVELSATGVFGDLQVQVERILEELQRIRQHGFLNSEIQLELKGYRRKLKKRNKLTPSSGNLIEIHKSAFCEGTLPFSYQQEWELFEEVLPHLERVELSKTFASQFNLKAGNLVIGLGQRKHVALPEKGDLTALINAVASRSVKPPKAFERFLAPMEVKSPVPFSLDQKPRKRDDFFNLELDNGLWFHLHPMKSTNLWVKINFPGGKICESSATLGITDAALQAFSSPALEHRSAYELAHWSSDRHLDYWASADEDVVSMTLKIGGTDLISAWQLVSSFISKPLLEPHLLERWRHGAQDVLKESEFDIQAILTRLWSGLLSGNDPRLLGPNSARLAQVPLAEAQSWLENLCTTAPIEIAVAGPFDPQRIIGEALPYLSQIPKRPGTVLALDPLRKLNPQVGLLHETHRVPVTGNRASIRIGWRVAPWKAVAERRALLVAAEILRERLFKRVRGQLRLAYGVHCAARFSAAYPAASYLAVSLSTKPALLEKARVEVEGAVAQFVTIGPSASELERAKAYMLSRVEKLQRKPLFWVSALAGMNLRNGGDLEAFFRAGEYYAKLDKEMVRMTLDKYVQPANRLCIEVHPDA